MTRSRPAHQEGWLEGAWRGFVVCCPKCGGSWLHQEAVVVFERSKEDGDVFEVEVTHDPVALRTATTRGSGNPSLRRNGFVVWFRCEACGDDPAEWIGIRFGQHKGQTEVEWLHSAIGSAGSQHV